MAKNEPVTVTPYFAEKPFPSMKALFGPHVLFHDGFHVALSDYVIAARGSGSWHSAKYDSNYRYMAEQNGYMEPGRLDLYRENLLWRAPVYENPEESLILGIQNRRVWGSPKEINVTTLTVGLWPDVMEDDANLACIRNEQPWLSPVGLHVEQDVVVVLLKDGSYRSVGILPFQCEETTPFQ